MAVLGRLLVSSAERLDLPDFLSIDSFTQGDFKYLMRSFVGGNKPYILTGFDVINPGSAIGTQNVSIRVADSVVYYPGSLAGPFFHGLEEGNIQAAPLVPELRKNTTNYVYLTLTTAEAAKDTRAFWDPDKEGGVGGEFTQDVNTQTVLSAVVNVSVSAFPDNTVPVCKIVVGANFIESIEDARDMMFRLGSGGINPNPLSTYSWRSEPSSSYTRTEPNTKMSSALDPNSFQGGDKNIRSLKEWMDAVMTKLAELGGTTYWYEDTSVYNLINVFKDSLATSTKSKGLWNSSDITPGMLTWTEDILIQSTSDLSEVIVRAGTKTLADNEVMYIDRVRDIAINTGGIAVDWFNGVDHINGQLGSFENLSKGDWVKKADDNSNLYLRVEEFYAAANKGGGVTAPGSALSIKLSAPYAGVSETKQGIYIKGVYLSSEVSVGDRASTGIATAAGNFYWLAMRSDTILKISDITTTQLSLDITDHDGLKAKVTSVAHGLSDGQKITISGSTNFNGTYSVSVETVDTFFINITGGPFADELGQTGFYATVTTAARATDDGLQLESANHGLTIDQTILISGTTNYNGSVKVFPTGSNTFTVPVSALIASENTGLTTIVNIYARTDIGPTRIDMGENKGIGQADGANLMSFIGMDNDAQTYPNYYITPDYNTIDAQENYNANSTDNLTQRVSKLTSMMAVKAQDKTIKITLDGIKAITNTTSGANQDIAFVQKDAAAGTITAIAPSTGANTTIYIDSGFSLAANQAAYFSIDRNAASTLLMSTDVIVKNISAVPLDENVFILAYRLGDTDVSLWDGSQINDFQNVLGLAKTEVTTITNVSAADITSGQYFTINSASDITEYYVWFNKDTAGGDPAILGKTPIEITVTTGDTNLIIAAAIQSALDALPDFNAVDNLDGTVTVTNAVVGATTDAANVDVGGAFAITIDIQGVGEVLHYISDGDIDAAAIKKLDESLNLVSSTLSSAISDLQDNVQQNRNLKLIEGGTWSWDLVSTTLTWSADAQVSIAGLSDSRNNILAGSVILANDGEVAYVSVNRDPGVAANLTINVADISLVSLTDDIVIIARRVGNNVSVGTSSFSLKNGEFLELDGALAEINRYHGQLAVKPANPVSTRIAISGSDILKLDGSKLSLEQKNLLLDFPGAVIDFATGSVFETDGITPFLGGINDFTPFTIGSNEYFYYSVSVLPNVAQADNTITGQILVIPAVSSNLVLANAPKAPFPGSGLKLANILVQENGLGGILNIDFSNITQLGVGGGGGGGTGDANSDLTRYQERLILSTFKYANTNIAAIDEDGQLDGTSTATYDIPSGNFKFADSTAQVLLSTQQLDEDFLAESVDLDKVELYAIWDLDAIDSGATYEVSRDGGNEFQTITMSRIGNSDSYRGILEFTNEASNGFNQEYAIANADDLKIFDDATQQAVSQKFTVINTTVYKNVLIYMNRANTDSVGKFYVEVVKDNAGSPSSDPNDSVWLSPAQNVTDLAVGNNVVNIPSQFVATTGDYHLIITTDSEYKNAYALDNTDTISVRIDSSAGPTPNLRTNDGSIWSAEVVDETMTYRLEGRELDVRVRITSSATANDKFLSSYGLFYNNEEGLEISQPVFRELFTFDGTVDNLNEFTLTNFLPDSRLLMVFALGTGQVFRYGDFVLQGHKVIFPVNTFNVADTVRLEFLQIQAVDGVASNTAEALVTANHLGSTDASIDKSVAGQGIFLRRPDGTLREIAIDDDDNIVVYSV